MNPDPARTAPALPNVFRRRAAAARALAVVCLLAAVPLIVAAVAGSQHLPRGRWITAAAAIGMILAVAVASFVSAAHLRQQARRLDASLARLQAGQFMVRWTYSAALWQAWSASVPGGPSFRVDSPSIVPAVAAIVAMVAAVASLRDQRAAAYTAAAALAAALLVFFMHWARRALRIRRQSPGVRECFIANDMLYFDEQPIFFNSHESRLASIAYHAGEIPEVRLRIVLLDRDGDDIRTLNVHIPVPPRGGSAARRVATRLRRRYDPASVHLTGRHPHHKLIHRNPPPPGAR